MLRLVWMLKHKKEDFTETDTSCYVHDKGDPVFLLGQFF